MISVPDIASELGPAEHLLVITPPGGSGCYGLRLPFHDATLIEAKPNGIPDGELPDQVADGVVIECPAGDASWADRILGELGTRISDTSTVVLAFVAEYGRIEGPDRFPAALPALRSFDATSMGMLGDAVSLVLTRQVAGDPAGTADAAAVVVPAVSRAAELATLAARGGRGRGSGERSAARNLAVTVTTLRGEIHQLSATLAKTQQELSMTTRRYRALRYSKLGKLTVRYWRFRTKLAARGATAR